MKFAWNEESTAALIELVEHRKPYNEIAAVLTARFGYRVDKNMVSGKVHRLGIGIGIYARPRGVFDDDRVMPSEPAPEGFRYVFQGPAGQRSLLGLVPVEKPVVIKGGIPMSKLGELTCRWPLWEANERPEVPRYCGAQTEPGRSYCQCHRKIAYTPAVRRPPMTEEQRLARRIAQLRRHEQMKVEREAREAAALKKPTKTRTKTREMA